MISSPSRLQQPRADRAGPHRNSRHVAFASQTMPQTLHCVILYSEDFHRDDQKADKKAGIETLVIANFKPTDPKFEIPIALH